MAHPGRRHSDPSPEPPSYLVSTAGRVLRPLLFPQGKHPGIWLPGAALPVSLRLARTRARRADESLSRSSLHIVR